VYLVHPARMAKLASSQACGLSWPVVRPVGLDWAGKGSTLSGNRAGRWSTLSGNRAVGQGQLTKRAVGQGQLTKRAVGQG